ncbi:polymer-forming cytoskeletal protein [Paenibacillus kobensis]|uniref:polymer-forming cytoskeletal protein n=1 Tax=Paenibacillus kobensis TaxID=59841 RepID=UPI000FDA6A5E|nr:polymer-forming cytoskeletal protein [Paenibacillus kobensis]
MKNSDMSSFGNLSVKGMGQAYGGQYRHVVIDGLARVSGNVQCETFRLNGMSRMNGSIDTDQMTINGVMNGKASIIAKRVNIDGKVNVRGSLVSDEIVLHGLLNLEGDCEAEQVIVRGGFGIAGLLNAGTIEVDLHGRCKAGEMGGSTIRVTRSRSSRASRLLSRIIPAFEPQLQAGVIEGDDVHLEATRASVVRGRRVYIGPGCEVDRVEYELELVVDHAAQVRETVKQQ